MVIVRHSFEGLQKALVTLGAHGSARGHGQRLSPAVVIDLGDRGQQWLPLPVANLLTLDRLIAVVARLVYRQGIETRSIGLLDGRRG